MRTNSHTHPQSQAADASRRWPAHGSGEAAATGVALAEPMTAAAVVAAPYCGQRPRQRKGGSLIFKHPGPGIRHCLPLPEVRGCSPKRLQPAAGEVPQHGAGAEPSPPCAAAHLWAQTTARSVTSSGTGKIAGADSKSPKPARPGSGSSNQVPESDLESSGPARISEQAGRRTGTKFKRKLTVTRRLPTRTRNPAGPQAAAGRAPAAGAGRRRGGLAWESKLRSGMSRNDASAARPRRQANAKAPEAD